MRMRGRIYMQELEIWNRIILSSTGHISYRFCVQKFGIIGIIDFFVLVRHQPPREDLKCTITLHADDPPPIIKPCCDV
jgi:hypothetical protein